MVQSDGADPMTANLVGSSSDKQALVAAPRWPLAYAALCLANMAEAVEVLTAGYILERATDDEFVQTSIAAAVFIGMMFGGLFSGPAADAYGRAALLKWALALSTAASFAAAASPEAVVLVLCRFVAGAGVGAATPPLFALAVELAPPGRSGPGVVAVQSFWMVGQISASAMADALTRDEEVGPGVVKSDQLMCADQSRTRTESDGAGGSPPPAVFARRANGEVGASPKHRSASHRCLKSTSRRRRCASVGCRAIPEQRCRQTSGSACSTIVRCGGGSPSAKISRESWR